MTSTCSLDTFHPLHFSFFPLRLRFLDQIDTFYKNFYIPRIFLLDNSPVALEIPFPCFSLLYSPIPPGRLLAAPLLCMFSNWEHWETPLVHEWRLYKSILGMIHYYQMHIV
jgi:hypothetical protein